MRPCYTCDACVHYLVLCSPQNAVDNVRIVLVGNKIDLENQREVSEKRGRKVSSRVCFGFRVSLPRGPPLAEISYAFH